MPAFTTPDGFIHEVPGDQPGISLTGGLDGSSDILAEQVQAKFQTTDGSLSTLQADVAALQNGTAGTGWIAIGKGTESGASFDIDATASGKFAPGEFDLLRLHMRYDLDDEGWVNLRLNNDAGPGGDAYQHGSLVYDADTGNLDEIFHGAARNSWRIGQGATISTNNLVCEILHTQAAASLHTYQSTSTRQSATASAHRWGQHWGSLTAGLSAPISSLRIESDAVPPATNFNNAWWWLEGWRAP